jgi:hypothetical protein
VPLTNVSRAQTRPVAGHEGWKEQYKPPPLDSYIPRTR